MLWLLGVPNSIEDFIQYLEDNLDSLIDMTCEGYEGEDIDKKACSILRKLEYLNGVKDLIDQSFEYNPEFAKEIKKDTLSWCISLFMLENNRYN
jgi:hypothetical protein